MYVLVGIYMLVETNKICTITICSSRKYLYFPRVRDLFQDPPPVRKSQLSFIHFFKFFGLIEPPTPQEIQIPSVGGVWIFSGTAQWCGTVLNQLTCVTVGYHVCQQWRLNNLVMSTSCTFYE